MALTGNIEVFPLPEVLRLLARSGKNGCLHIAAGSVDGRMYLRDGSITFATVSSDTEFLDQLSSSGLVEDQRAETIRGDGVRLADVLSQGSSPGDLTEFVREHLVEAVYRIRKPGFGNFEFLVDAYPRFETGQGFDVESTVADADRRAADWADIEQSISDMNLPVRMVRSLRESEVSISAPTWKVLASLEGGASVSEIARLLGTTEFKAAREVAGLMRSSLIEPVQFSTPTYPVPSTFQAPSDHTPQAPPDWSQDAPQAPADWSQDAPQAPADWSQDTPQAPADWSQDAPQAPARDFGEPEAVPSPWETKADPASDRSWDTQPWSEVVSEETHPVTAPATEAAPAAESTDEESPEPTRGGWWAEAMTTDEPVVDTDEFLESVFSQAEGSEADEEETGFSMGLLRRRRMGPAARDIADSR
jgi:hypothetical protein